MKTLISTLVLIALSVQVHSQLSIKIINNTNCSMYYAVEGASTTNCTGQGGVYGWVDPGYIYRTIPDDFPRDGLSVDFINWAMSEPDGTSCTIIASAEWFDTVYCGGSDVQGQASGCCVDDWVVEVSGTKVNINP